MASILLYFEVDLRRRFALAGATDDFQDRLLNRGGETLESSSTMRTVAAPDNLFSHVRSWFVLGSVVGCALLHFSILPLQAEEANKDLEPNVARDVDPAPDPCRPEVKIFLSDGKGHPGEVVTLDLGIFTTTEIKSLSIALNFDETVVRVIDIRRRRDEDTKPILAEDLRSTNVDNRNEVDGDQLREGWIHLDLAQTAADSFLGFPQNVEFFFLEIDFLIRPGVFPGVTAVSFEDVGPVTVLNQLVVLTNSVTLSTDGVDCPETLRLQDEDTDGGEIEIIGEVGFFIRGDADMDCRRTIEDPILSLRHLFLEETEPSCLDAVDANDSGKLDVSDPIFSLLWLFSGGEDYTEPFLRPDEDPTEDLLDCATGYLKPEECFPNS